MSRRGTLRRLAAAAAAGLAAAAAGAPWGGAPAAERPRVTGYDGANPFACRLQQLGQGTDYPDPEADPLCVEFDKTHQSVSDGGVIAFLAGEPARVAAAGDRCFYFQHDHWRGSVVRDDGATETYHWDGSYFFDKARGVGGVYVENFTLNGRSADPRGLPGFPAAWKPFFGHGRGGLRLRESVPAEARCAERARRGGIYASPALADPAPRLGLRLDYERGRTRAGRRCARAGLRARVTGADARNVAWAEFAVDGRRLARDRRAPFARRLPVRALRRHRRSRVEALVALRDGRRDGLLRRLRGCPAAR